MEYRDMSKPYTEEEIEETRQLFRSLKTYKDGYVYAEDVPVFIKGLKWDRTPEQVQAYKLYWEEEWGGKCSEEVFINFCKVLGSNSLFAREFAITADKEKNGCISTDKFLPILKVMKIHDSRLSDKTFEDSVKKADIYTKDGLVKIEECTKLIEKHAPNK